MSDEELSWARYNDEVIQTECRRCGAQKHERCRGPLGRNPGKITVAHAVRIEEAGYKWNHEWSLLEKLPQGKPIRVQAKNMRTGMTVGEIGEMIRSTPASVVPKVEVNLDGKIKAFIFTEDSSNAH